jgi:Mrp family chromosome partitioning ATPase
MASRHDDTDAQTLVDYLAVLRRRRWIVIAVALLVPVAVVLYTSNRGQTYSAESYVLLTKGSQTVGGAAGAARAAATQARLAASPAVAARALAAAGVHNRTVTELLASSDVKAQPDSDLLRFKVADRQPALAMRLATGYADAFTAYRRALDSQAAARSRARVGEELGRVDAGDPLYSTFVRKQRELLVDDAAQDDAAVVVSRATDVSRAGVRPARNFVVGAGVGLILGVLLAFIVEALDTRVRSADEISAALGLPLLARLPAPPKRLRAQNQLVTLADPNGARAEAFRVLRTNLDFFDVDRAARGVMVTSAGEKEGKTTTVANLAVVLARAGRRVVLVDLDLRRPSLDRLFRVDRAPGVTDVAFGRVPLQEALSDIELGDAGHEAHANGRGTHSIAPLMGGDGGHERLLRRLYPSAIDRDDDLPAWLSATGSNGSLQVLPAGSPVRDIGELVGGPVVTDVLDALHELAEIVLIDGPPLLGAGDGIALSNRVDALLVVARLNTLVREHVDELGRVLNNARAAKLGFIVTDAEFDGGNARTQPPRPRPVEMAGRG